MIQALRETGQLENTLILFLSDNGASPENCAAYGPGFDRPSETRDGRKIVYDVKKQVMPGPETSFVSIGQRWANVSNTPYQYWKAESYEGGIHTPLIAYWPKGIKVKAGSFSDHVGHVMDLMSTFTELSGAKYPAIYKGYTIPPTTGISLAASFRGAEGLRGAEGFGGVHTPGHEVLFNEHFGARYAREGDWKMVAMSKDSGWRLFNLAVDRTETVDLAAQNPEKVRHLDSLWHQWANTHFVFPKPGRKE
jgi:arylsulfatase